MKFFIIIFFTLFAYLNYSIGNFYFRALNISGSSLKISWLLYILATVTIIAAPIVYRKYPQKYPGFFYNSLQWVGYIFFGIYSVLAFFMLIDQVGFFFYHHLGHPDKEKQSLVLVVLANISFIVTIVVSWAGYFSATKNPELKRISIPIENLPDDFHGITILQMSDVHVGQTIKSRFVNSLVKMSNELSPDIVVLTGDLTDGAHSELAHELIDFKKINAPLGKFMIPGNHEYYWGFDKWITHWEELGFVPLLNEHKIIQKNDSQVIMAGVHDYSAHRIKKTYLSSPSMAINNAPENLVKILLAHQPRSVYEAARVGYDLQLSGHTHSGQYFPFNILIYLFQPYVKGLSRHKKTWIYVNQGTGYWGPPNRFGAPPEVTLIELIKADVVLKEKA